MNDKVKVIVGGEDTYKVEDRDGIQTCIFKTEDGREVLFQRDKQGRIVKVTTFGVDCFSAVAARTKIAVEKLLNNPFLEKGPKHSVKVVSAKAPGMSRKQLVRDAYLHAWAIDPHEKD